jgi:hypothetical protein
MEWYRERYVRTSTECWALYECVSIAGHYMNVWYCRALFEYASIAVNFINVKILQDIL